MTTGIPFRLSEVTSGAKLDSYDLITLSACETALGGAAAERTNRGSEVEGFGVWLQKHGAKSVLASLWKIDDVGAALWMEAFYKFRGEQRKLTKAKAVGEVQRKMLDRKLPDDEKNPKKRRDFTLPYYWAPFILMGNWL